METKTSELTNQEKKPSNAGSGFSVPTISLPKGGGAIRGMGEKFAANPVTGTGAMTVPIVTSPGRSGFGPQLSLSYDSGSGNGPFGFGWSLLIPSITRKTDKGLPQYFDAEESDVFILSGAEDLVPEFEKDAVGSWVIENGRHKVHDKPRTVNGVIYNIRRYRPRIEGLFARIERWTRQSDGESHWRSITRDNITTLYGKDNNSRIFDPADSNPAHPTRIFSWLICESYDDKGNHIVYKYKEEDALEVDLAQAHEKNRPHSGPLSNRYLKQIYYGNKVSRLAPPDPAHFGWMFEVVFDYGEGHYAEGPPDVYGNVFAQAYTESPAGSIWPTRPDPFSSYRAGFETRTYRLCQRVLMFHHFATELGTNDYLVRSTDFIYDSNPTASFITGVIQSGYRLDNGQYLKKSLPPLEFSYSQIPTAEQLARQPIQAIDAQNLENLPQGLDNAAYQWVDLDGEGLSGILTEQADAWLYKRNLGEGNFGPLERVMAKPSVAALNSGRQQLLDLAGDGQIDLVTFSGPTPGFYKRTQHEGWETHKAFKQLPNIAWDDPNLRFVDLNGDGQADVLVTEGDVFSWYPSLAEDGFDWVEQVAQPRDEERGPRLVFSDGTQSIYMADMSGDGLTDLMRIRNGEVCYWPNLGYGRFGAKVTTDNAPWFDTPEMFDQRRIRLADIDGSGVVDILYLTGNGVHLYFNQSGNAWSERRTLSTFPRIDNLSSVSTLDLLGNGTACLVWSSPLPDGAHSTIRYIDLMGGQKPHLLIKTKNNLGAETEVEYASSTRYYLKDKQDGKPWVTKLPFPVHVVAKSTVTDNWRNTKFSSTYSYHHGYFDGIEREFRGFGRVEQVDVESYGTFANGNAASPFITDDQTLFQPPVKTVTWFHTGAFFDRERILSQLKEEYFPHWFEAQGPDERNVLGDFRENDLPEPDLDAAGLTAVEWREALRACKGMMLRQEIYELDVDAQMAGEDRPLKLFSTAYHNSHIRRLQPRGDNRYAVFLVTENEAITYNYELDLRTATLTPDPRIAHTLNLQSDEFGNVLQAVAVVYPRIGRHEDSTLPAAAEALIDQVQAEMHLAYTETRYTNDVNDPADPDNYRLRVPCEVLTYELTGIGPEDQSDRESTDLRDNSYFTLDELRRYRLSDVHQTEGLSVSDIPYHRFPLHTAAEKRSVEHVRMLFFHENLNEPLPFGILNRLGLPYETYKLALTEALNDAVFGAKLTPEIHAALGEPARSGYLSGATLAARFPAESTTGQYWVRSGIAGFAPDAAEHFYLPERYTDPFGNTITLEYDVNYDLFIRSSTDPLANRTEVTRFDYRMLAPLEMQDMNGNRSEVYFDVLGLPAAMAIKGKGSEGDNLSGFNDALANPAHAELTAFFVDNRYDETQARTWLGNATARHVYYFGETRHPDGSITWGTHPSCATTILREKHVSQLAADEPSPLQLAFEYSDGGGNVLVKKVQAEPETEGGSLRWIANGKTILNNKGKPVKQYEPYFTDTHIFEESREQGVTPIMYYDAAGRLMRTEMPDGTFSKVEFSPWQVKTFDANDTVLESAWYAARGSPDPGLALPLDIAGRITATPDFRAAWLAAQHAATPAEVHLDSLGREVIAIAHNRTQDSAQNWQDEKYVTFTRLDAEGKPMWIRDARGNLVMQYITPAKANNDPSDVISAGAIPCYDIAGNLLFQHSMDAGDRWTINDAAGKPFYVWDENDRITEGGDSIMEQRVYHTTYDALHRPLAQRLQINAGEWQVTEHFIYGETHPDAEARNLRGQVYRHYDPSGLVSSERFDFKGNLLEVTRRLASVYDAPMLDWGEGSPTAGLEVETYTQSKEYDSLNRMTHLENWHLEGRAPAIYIPQYNERGALQSETLTVHGLSTQAIFNIEYDAKGQRSRIQYGNGTTTRYGYDPLTFRLIQLRTTRTGTGGTLPSLPSDLSEPNALQNLYYTYDPVGNITEIHDDAYEPVFFNNQRVEPRNRYTYDALYRLIVATGRENYSADQAPGQFEVEPYTVRFPVDGNALRNYTQRYIYDSVGNFFEMRHAADGGSWTRHYETASDSNRLLRTWTGSDEGNAVRYDYDTHGSMLNFANVPNEYRTRWDYRDMISDVNLGGGGHAFYSYDAGKQRSRKRIVRRGGAVEERVFLGGMEHYHSFASSGEVLEEIETHHLFVDDQRVLLVDDVLTTDNTALGEAVLYKYQYSNHLGSVGLELDASAAVISYEEYHPYGTSAYRATGAGVRATARRYRYTGMERDEETGLSYHTARYYMPWLGRWLSADSLENSDSANLYLYCLSNPLAYLDKDGSQGLLFSVGSTYDRTSFEGHTVDESEVYESGRRMVWQMHNELFSIFAIETQITESADGIRLSLGGTGTRACGCDDVQLERVRSSIRERVRSEMVGRPDDEVERVTAESLRLWETARERLIGEIASGREIILATNTHGVEQDLILMRNTGFRIYANPFSWYIRQEGEDGTRQRWTRAMEGSSDRALMAFGPAMIFLHELDHDFFRDYLFPERSVDSGPSSASAPGQPAYEERTVDDIDMAIRHHPLVAQRLAYYGAYGALHDRYRAYVDYNPGQEVGETLVEQSRGVWTRRVTRPRPGSQWVLLPSRDEAIRGRRRFAQ